MRPESKPLYSSDNDLKVESLQLLGCLKRFENGDKARVQTGKTWSNSAVTYVEEAPPDWGELYTVDKWLDWDPDMDKYFTYKGHHKPGVVTRTNHPKPVLETPGTVILGDVPIGGLLCIPDALVFSREHSDLPRSSVDSIEHASPRKVVAGNYTTAERRCAWIPRTTAKKVLFGGKSESWLLDEFPDQRIKEETTKKVRDEWLSTESDIDFVEDKRYTKALSCAFNALSFRLTLPIFALLLINLVFRFFPMVRRMTWRRFAERACV